MNKTCDALLLSLAIIAFTGCGQKSPSSGETKPALEAEHAALAAAQAWLQLVDGGSYAKSWEEAASFFKSAVSQEDWEKSMRAFRSPLGALSSRELATQKYSTSLPGAPDGEYVVIQFNSSFANKASTVETITPMLEKDGTWRVSGYFIK